MQPTCALNLFSKFIYMPTSICISGCIKNSYFHNGILERDGGPFTTFHLWLRQLFLDTNSADCQHQSNWDTVSSEYHYAITSALQHTPKRFCILEYLGTWKFEHGVAVSDMQGIVAFEVFGSWFSTDVLCFS